jgi:hypothetical protein
MGKNVGRMLFGGPEKSKSSSYNVNRDLITNAMKPTLGNTAEGSSMMGSLLGMNGGAAQTQGLENFAESGGMSFMREQGNKQINSNQAARGLLRSGGTLEELEKYGQGLGSTYLNQYMDQLNKYSQIGLASGALAATAGQKSKSSATGKKEGAVQQAAKIASSFMGAPA